MMTPEQRKLMRHSWPIKEGQTEVYAKKCYHCGEAFISTSKDVISCYVCWKKEGKVNEIK